MYESKIAYDAIMQITSVLEVKVENPAITFTKLAGAGAYDHLDNDEYDACLAECERTAELWGGKAQADVREIALAALAFGEFGVSRPDGGLAFDADWRPAWIRLASDEALRRVREADVDSVIGMITEDARATEEEGFAAAVTDALAGPQLIDQAPEPTDEQE